MHILNVAYLLSLLAFLPLPGLAAVLAIDYGTDWIKASLMKPGVPFDVLLNKDSKRKIQSSVAWKKSDRLFGTDAFNLASRFPSDSFSYVKYLQGVPFDSEFTQYFTSISSTDLVETARKTVGFKQSDGTVWSTEELIAMQFAYVRNLAEAVAGEKVHDVVVTVPPYYTSFERDAVADAVEIAGLRTLALVNDGTAVAVNYAMTRTFPTPEYHVIYDAGASAIRATVVQFSTDSKGASPATHINVAGVGYDRNIGGAELDRRLREILVDAFINKHKRDIRSDKRGMAKLWKEAGRVKAILSANTEATATVESAAFDIDFKTKVSRAQFEAACEDLKSKFAHPIFGALHNAGLTLDNVTSVIFTGGSTRTPMIQAAVKAAVGEDKVSLNVNADEAAVLGAGLHGASLSRQFKTKNIKVSDISLYDIQASYFASATSPNVKPRTITTMIFAAGSKVGTKKTLTFKRKEDFTIHLDYKNKVAPGFPTRMVEAELTGVAEGIANLTERGAIDPVVKATLTLSESGFVSVSDAVVYGEIKDESLTGKLKDFFGASSSSTDDETQSVENIPPRDSSTETTSSSSTETTSSSSASSSTDAQAKPTKKALPKENTIKLNITNRFTTIPPLTPEEKREARSRLRAIDLEESAKTRKEEARNSLESYLYRLRDLLDEENKNTPFKECSQESERKAIQDKMEETFNWLHDKGDIAETSQLLDKRNGLETLERPIIHRYQEIEAFPQALNNNQMWNWSTRLFLAEARQNLTQEEEAGLPSKWTGEELDALEKTLKDHESWLGTWVEKQRSIKRNEDPVIETTEMRARAKVLEQHLQRLFRRKVPKATKKPTSTSTTETPIPTETLAAEETAEVGEEEWIQPVTEEEELDESVPEPEPTHDEL